ncbi:hypothetical protein ACHAWF_012095 [Thalassiosira exigua]
MTMNEAESGPPVVLTSIARGAMGVPVKEDSAELYSIAVSTGEADFHAGGARRRHGTRTADDDADFDENHSGGDDHKNVRGESISFPPSTHSLLFTEPVVSWPFAFAVGIAALSFSCLALSFYNNYSSGEVPANVLSAVRAAQYLSILVTLLMEEEIPTGLYQLRMIPKESLRQKFPQMKYRKFILASVLRLLNGYFFLVNVLLVLIYATGVLEIFYDVLALQFVQQLDDIAFSLAKIDVFGKALQRACTAKCFETEFERQRTGKSKRLSIFLKAIYFFNLFGMFAAMAVISVKQTKGDYYDEKITVDFGDTIWARAWVKIPSWLPEYLQTSPVGEYEPWTLVYSYFNGVFEKEDELLDGRPVYKERRKSDRSPFEQKVPAAIRYCADIKAWVFTHESISRIKPSNSSKRSMQGCNWLLRSPETDEFDLLNVVGNWKVWVGTIGNADVSIASTECAEDSDCNLNGECVDGICNCYKNSGALYLGTHCEVTLRDDCQTITGEGTNETHSVVSLSELTGNNAGSNDALVQLYSRPAYTYQRGTSTLTDEGLDRLTSYMQTEYNVTVDFFYRLIYSGDRWFGMPIAIWTGAAAEEILFSYKEYHAFWDRAYRPGSTYTVSDRTTGGTPVGTDFYTVDQEKRGEQYGPFGVLYPFQNQTGRGYFRCSDLES